MSENHRGPEVPEEEVSAVECLDGLARITSKELAITHFVEIGTLQNACSTRLVVGLGKSAHIVRLMNSRRKGLKRIMTKSAVAMLKKGNWQERESVSDACHDRTGQPVKRSDKKLGQNSSKRRFSDARQLGCVFQDMTPPKSILQKSTNMPKPIQRVKQRLLHVIPKFETKIPRTVTFVQVHLMSVGPTLQNLRIVHKKRQSGKSKVPAKQRGSWPKMCSN